MLNKKISILGCGWLGLPLALDLIDKSYLVKGSTTSIEKIVQLKENGIDSFKIDLSKHLDNIQPFLASDILIICVTSKDDKDFIKLIDKIEKSTIKKVIFVSSTSVYLSENKMVTEESPTNGFALNCIESLFKNNTKFNTTILRFAGLYGYDRKPSLFHKIDAVIKNPEGFINLIHRDDCINIITRLIENDVWEETFNACSDFHPKRRDYYTVEKLKIELPQPIFDETSKEKFKIVNSDKLKAILKYNFKH